MAATTTRLGPVDVKGGLWGADLLAALADDRTKLPAGTIKPDSYGLPSRASTEQAARAAWTVLTAAWEEFTELHAARVERDGTGAYGQDRFTHDTWLVHLLDQLGYQPVATPPGGLAVDRDDDTDEVDRYSITYLHVEQVPLHLLDAGVPLDRRTPRVIGAHSQSPHSLVQDYLNRTSRHLWAVLTNGLTLRILRDNAALSRQAYIEFDLAGIFDDGAYADFALLWHAVHATRFTHDPDTGPASCIAESWQEHATATGVAALEDLREGVEAAIAELGQGLIEHPANIALRSGLEDPDDAFDAAAMYRELLYVAYRHVFWFTLDDRGLLHPPDADRAKVTLYRNHYASTVLRGKARAHLGAQHPDGWQHFRTIARWFADPGGQPALDLSGLLGRLWEPQATVHVDATTLTNRRYYEAVRRLAYVTRDGALQRINYDAMGSEELGAVYEALLEIRPTVDTTQRTFTLGRAAGSDRKKTGSYYTPTSLIKVLLDEALDPVLDERIKQAVHNLPVEATPEQRRDAQEQAILATTVCDPAMGSAHFLVGAGMRMAKRLAQLRTEEAEPSPDAVQRAFRDVASRCLYGVDINPMAVELAKVAIWLECHVPGQPLTFLDHHLKTGNALLGIGFDPDLIAWRRTAKKATDQKGVPDAAFKPLAGDDKAHARLLRDRNKQRRGAPADNVRFHGAGSHVDRLDQLVDNSRQLTDLTDSTPDALTAKQQAFDAAQHDPELLRQQLRADAWMAAWTFPKTKKATTALTSYDPLADDELPWDIYYDTFLDDDLHIDRPGARTVRDEAERLTFFHWYLEFPDIAAVGGFGLCLGNPPWERIKLAEKEWFAAAGYPDIANAENAAARKRAIAALGGSNDPVDQRTVQQWELDSRDAQSTSEFARNGQRFPYGGVGDVNTYALFADHFTQAVAPWGRVGIIVPTGLLTDYTYREFFGHLIDQRRLAAAYDFENKGKRLFPEVHASFRFVTLIATAPGGADEARFAFMIHDPAELDNADRSYALAPDEIVALNPVTKLAPSMLAPRDVNLALRASKAIGSLHENWRWETRAGIVLASVDGLNVVAEARTAFMSEGGYSGLFEAKAVHHYDIRRATYQAGEGRAPTSHELADPAWLPTMRNSVADKAVARKLADINHGELMLGWRDIARDTDARTLICLALPVGGVDNTFNVAFPEHGDFGVLALVAIMSTFACDWQLRQRAAGTHVKPHMVESLPVPSLNLLTQPAAWNRQTDLASWMVRRAAALSARTELLAGRLGYGTPVNYEPHAQEVWLIELEAAMFHLYGYSADEVGYVMDTFPVVARKDRQTEDLADDDPNWRTKRLIRDKYDELAACIRAGQAYEGEVPPPPLPERLGLRMRDNADLMTSPVGRVER